VQKVIGKVLFNQVAFIATTNNEVVDAIVRVHLHDVPQNGFPPDFDHGLWASGRFFA
jgi:hypothetical protein